ncbi:MAG: hypothetical protein QOD42_2040 [Sphingomonadales bacterium]|jgi:hypothetical protein|nr:hypothetical protein [Sphingomonadales bacterium]
MPVTIRALSAAAAVIAIPAAVAGAQQPARTKSQYSTKRVCEVAIPTGSRLGGVRRCRSAAERELAKQEARQAVDRVQMFKPACAGPRRCPG